MGKEKNRKEGKSEKKIIKRTNKSSRNNVLNNSRDEKPRHQINTVAQTQVKKVKKKTIVRTNIYLFSTEGKLNFLEKITFSI